MNRIILLLSAAAITGPPPSEGGRRNAEGWERNPPSFSLHTSSFRSLRRIARRPAAEYRLLRRRQQNPKAFNPTWGESHATVGRFGPDVQYPHPGLPNVGRRPQLRATIKGDKPGVEFSGRWVLDPLRP